MSNKTVFRNINGEQVEVLDERTYRTRLFALANDLGCVEELKRIFNRFDGLMQRCTNKEEAKAIAAMGVQEISSLLDNGNVGKGGAVTIAGSTIVDDRKEK
jgi:hypothetical protein